MFNGQLRYTDNLYLKTLSFLDADALAQFASCSQATNKMRADFESRSTASQFSKIILTQTPKETAIPIKNGRMTQLYVYKDWLFVTIDIPRIIKIYNHTATPARQIAEIVGVDIADINDEYALCMPRKGCFTSDLSVVNLNSGKSHRLDDLWQLYSLPPKFFGKDKVVLSDGYQTITVFKQNDGTRVASCNIDFFIRETSCWKNTILIAGPDHVFTWDPGNSTTMNKLVSKGKAYAMVVANDHLFCAHECCKYHSLSITNLYDGKTRLVRLESGNLCLTLLDDHSVLAVQRDSVICLFGSSEKIYPASSWGWSEFHSPLLFNEVKKFTGHILNDREMTKIMDLSDPFNVKTYPFHGIDPSSDVGSTAVAMAPSSSKIFYFKWQGETLYQMDYFSPKQKVAQILKQKVKRIAKWMFRRRLVRTGNSLAKLASKAFGIAAAVLRCGRRKYGPRIAPHLDQKSHTPTEAKKEVKEIKRPPSFGRDDVRSKYPVAKYTPKQQHTLEYRRYSFSSDAFSIFAKGPVKVYGTSQPENSGSGFVIPIACSLQARSPQDCQTDILAIFHACREYHDLHWNLREDLQLTSILAPLKTKIETIGIQVLAPTAEETEISEFFAREFIPDETEPPLNIDVLANALCKAIIRAKYAEFKNQRDRIAFQKRNRTIWYAAWPYHDELMCNAALCEIIRKQHGSDCSFQPYKSFAIKDIEEFKSAVYEGGWISYISEKTRVKALVSKINGDRISLQQGKEKKIILLTDLINCQLIKHHWLG